MKARRFILSALSATFPALVVGCAERGEKSPASTTETTSAEMDTEIAQSGAARGMTREDREFAAQASQGNRAEVALGKMAQQKGASPQVKTFGTMMVTDHGKANAELERIAGSKGVALPKELSPEQNELEGKLSKLSGAAFDGAYSRAMIEDHEKDVAEYEKASTTVKDPELRAWAAATLPTLKEHLEHAKQLQPKARTR